MSATHLSWICYLVKKNSISCELKSHKFKLVVPPFLKPLHLSIIEYMRVLGETFFICWITFHQVKFVILAIAKKKRHGEISRYVL